MLSEETNSGIELYGNDARILAPNVPPVYVPVYRSATAAPSAPAEDERVNAATAVPLIAMSPIVKLLKHTKGPKARSFCSAWFNQTVQYDEIVRPQESQIQATFQLRGG